MDSSRLLDPEEIAVRAGREPAWWRRARPDTLFGERAMRLRQLAPGHPLADWLRFAAELSDAQHQAALAFGATDDPGVPPAEAFRQAALDGVPPLPWADTWRDARWRAVLRALLATMAPRLAPDSPAAATAAALAALGDDALDAQAARLLAGDPDPEAFAAVPFVAAALQVHATLRVDAAARRHEGLREGVFGRIDDPRSCPCCGGPPVASVLPLGTEVAGQRYLQCALCASQWNLVRITCAGCGNTRGLEYRHLQPATLADDEAGRQAAVVRAETCPECHGYLKLVAQDQDPHADAVADDVATLPLDLLLAEAGFQRLGVNFLLMAAPPAGPAD